MRRLLNDAFVSAGAIGVLLMLLVAFDRRVRDQVVLRVAGHPTASAVAAGNEVRDVASIVMDVVNDAVRLHTTLAIFVVIATVLTVFMVRT